MEVGEKGKGKDRSRGEGGGKRWRSRLGRRGREEKGVRVR